VLKHARLQHEIPLQLGQCCEVCKELCIARIHLSGLQLCTLVGQQEIKLLQACQGRERSQVLQMGAQSNGPVKPNG
jgi:hypothetical protein